MNLLKIFKTYHINDLENHYKSQSALLDSIEVRKRIPICVIDDELFFQLDLLQSHGFDIVQVWNINSLSSIEKFEIIACDLRGVGSKFSEKLQGASIIQEIKRSRPEKFIIAYSGIFDRSNMARIANDYADTKLNKSDDTDKWVRTLDEAIKVTSDPVERWKRIKRGLHQKEVNTQIILNLERAYCKSIILNNKNYFVSASRKSNVSDELKPIIQGLISSAIWAGVTYSA